MAAPSAPATLSTPIRIQFEAIQFEFDAEIQHIGVVLIEFNPESVRCRWKLGGEMALLHAPFPPSPSTPPPFHPSLSFDGIISDSTLI